MTKHIDINTDFQVSQAQKNQIKAGLLDHPLFDDCAFYLNGDYIGGGRPNDRG